LTDQHFEAMTPRHGAAQSQFTKDVRTATDLKQHKCFHQADWRNATPLGGKHIGLNADKKIETESFCIKPICSWVPHLSTLQEEHTRGHCGFLLDCVLQDSSWDVFSQVP